MAEMTWPAAEVIDTARLILEPLRVEHASELAPALDDDRLHEYIGGQPATEAELTDRFTHQVAGHSPAGDQGWLNWVLRRRDTNAVIGTVQATMVRAAGTTSADVAWIVATAHQRNGYAGEAAHAMVAWLRQHGVQQLVAYVHPDHRASIGVARQLGLVPTGVVVDGETRWISDLLS